MYALSEKYKLSFPTTHKYVLIKKIRSTVVYKKYASFEMRQINMIARVNSSDITKHFIYRNLSFYKNVFIYGSKIDP